MVLGLAFLVLGISAVVLQAWLWGPQFWDAAANKTRAPRAWLRVHRYIGYFFFGIYVFMMWQMVPRLWQYQVELPARTVFHAVTAITLGVLLLTKLSILRFFRHFEEAMPMLGMGILLCTVVLSALSIPFTLRAHALDRSPVNVQRVQRLVTELAIPGSDPGHLVSPSGLDRGRRVLTSECTVCHDLRTILSKPRAASGWYDVVQRMAEKPTVIGDPIQLADIPYVTAYLVAITPNIQASAKRRSDGDERQVQASKAVENLGGGAGANALDVKECTLLVEKKCTQCHELDELDKHGGDDEPGWTKIVRKMVVEEEAKLLETEARNIISFLTSSRPKGLGPTKGGKAP